MNIHQPDCHVHVCRIHALYSVMEGEVPLGITIGTIGFCALEVVIHTMFGIQMYQRFHAKGKQTIYGPGSITAYFGFGVFGIILATRSLGARLRRRIGSSLPW